MSYINLSRATPLAVLSCSILQNYFQTPNCPLQSKCLFSSAPHTARKQVQWLQARAVVKNKTKNSRNISTHFLSLKTLSYQRQISNEKLSTQAPSSVSLLQTPRHKSHSVCLQTLLGSSLCKSECETAAMQIHEAKCSAAPAQSTKHLKQNARKHTDTNAQKGFRQWTALPSQVHPAAKHCK